MHIPTMEQQHVKDPNEEPVVQKQPAPKVSNLPKTSLHDTDIKFISEAVKVISNIDGASQLKVRVHDKLPSVFSLAVTKPPRLCPDDLQQLQMLTTRVRKIKFDFTQNKLTIECWKHRKEPTSKKRDREDDMVGDHTLPKSYSLDMVDKMDVKHVSGILSFLVYNTTLEFNIDIHTDVTCYRVLISNLEMFDITLIESLIKKYGAFISNLYFDFPKGVLEVCIRRNDSPLDTISTVRPRKRLRLKN